uniref:BTB domain-containing protein n=1 Tax=Panagrolaimus davidi TaxID=227884 RepID=A0A914Q7T7_9BILA
MNQQQIIFNFQVERFELFKAQNLETGKFDVAFDIGGKILYAHKFILCPISSTFEAMLSDRWTKVGDPIKIEEYFHDDFKQFLTFLYSGQCQLSNDNIFAMVDIAEFYGVQAFKKFCEELLVQTEYTVDNVFLMVELAKTYSLKKLEETVTKFISDNFAMFFKSPQFQALPKSTVKFLIEVNQETPMQEEMFEGVFQWAEKQAKESLEAGNGLDLNGAIKDAISEFLPLINFKSMNSVFLIKFVVKKSFLFSGDELSDILWASNKLFAKVTDKNGKVMKGEIQCGDAEWVTNIIQSVKNRAFYEPDHDICRWDTVLPRPSKPSKLIKSDKVEWYLIYDDYDTEDIGITITSQEMVIDEDYLIAEMSAEDGFELSEDCKIEIY